MPAAGRAAGPAPCPGCWPPRKLHGGGTGCRQAVGGSCHATRRRRKGRQAGHRTWASVRTWRHCRHRLLSSTLKSSGEWKACRVGEGAGRPGAWQLCCGTISTPPPCFHALPQRTHPHEAGCWAVYQRYQWAARPVVAHQLSQLQPAARTSEGREVGTQAQRNRTATAGCATCKLTAGGWLPHSTRAAPAVSGWREEAARVAHRVVPRLVQVAAQHAQHAQLARQAPQAWLLKPSQGQLPQARQAGQHPGVKGVRPKRPAGSAAAGDVQHLRGGVREGRRVVAGWAEGDAPHRR